MDNRSLLFYQYVYSLYSMGSAARELITRLTIDDEHDQGEIPPGRLLTTAVWFLNASIITLSGSSWLRVECFVGSSVQNLVGHLTSRTLLGRLSLIFDTSKLCYYTLDDAETRLENTVNIYNFHHRIRFEISLNDYFQHHFIL
jgi:hypothetical protein